MSYLSNGVRVERSGAAWRYVQRPPNLVPVIALRSQVQHFPEKHAAPSNQFLEKEMEIDIGSWIDFLAPQQGVPQFELFEQKLADLPDEVKAKIFRENARKLLRLAAT